MNTIIIMTMKYFFNSSFIPCKQKFVHRTKRKQKGNYITTKRTDATGIILSNAFILTTSKQLPLLFCKGNGFENGSESTTWVITNLDVCHCDISGCDIAPTCSGTHIITNNYCKWVKWITNTNWFQTRFQKSGKWKQL